MSDEIDVVFTAFPVTAGQHVYAAGMSLRDWFAGQAMAALYSTINGVFKTGANDIEADAKLFYKIADAMIAARETGGAA